MRVLNVGGGSKDIPLPASYSGFDHVLLDISPGPGVDIVADLLTWEPTPEFDVVYCSHNLEHYYAHQTLPVLQKFRDALLPSGIVHIRVPDLEEVFKLIVEHNLDLEDVLYECPVGPIMAQDVIYGWGEEIKRSGEPFYAHKTGFTEAKLGRMLSVADFGYIKIVRHNLEIEAMAVKL
jgi:SAM-dependent methyltransferase